MQPDQIKAVELSVIWCTEGKGDEDVGLHYFKRYSQEEEPLDPRSSVRFVADEPLPDSPLSYDGLILKIRWCVRVRLFLPRGETLVHDEPFQLGACAACPAAGARGNAGVGRLVRDAVTVAQQSLRDALHAPGPDAVSVLRPGRTCHDCSSSGCASRRWWGQIVGTARLGKVDAAGRAAARAGSGRPQRHAHRAARRTAAPAGRCRKRAALRSRAMQLVIDGYEQLSRWQRLRIKRRCRLAGCGLLVTAHLSVGLAGALSHASRIWRRHVRVVQALLGERSQELISRPRSRRWFHAASRQPAQMLFALYDLYERRR